MSSAIQTNNHISLQCEAIVRTTSMLLLHDAGKSLKLRYLIQFILVILDIAVVIVVITVFIGVIIH